MSLHGATGRLALLAVLLVGCKAEEKQAAEADAAQPSDRVSDPALARAMINFNGRDSASMVSTDTNGDGKVSFAEFRPGKTSPADSQ